MPIYEIEQYELHAQTYRIEAESEAEAIKRLLGGEAAAADNALEYIEVADDLGLPVDRYPELVDDLRALEVTVGQDVIPSIRSIRRVDS